MSTPEIINALLDGVSALALLMIGWFWYRLGEIERKAESQISKLSDAVQTVQLDQARHYVTRKELTAAIKRFEDKLDQIFAKLDGKADR